MKRVVRSSIFAATLGQIVGRIQTKFENTNGVSSVVVTNFTDTYCQLKIEFDPTVYPGVRPTSITVWYDYHTVNNGTRVKTKWLTWSPDFTVNDDGSVVDKTGEIIGEVRILQPTNERVSKTRKNFLLKSIRTDSGDVIIDHPESVQDNSIYQEVVETLANRKVIRRS